MVNRSIKILATDDKKDNHFNLKALINEAFPEAIIFTAHDGASIIELAAAEDPDVILLDIIMPGMDGFEVCYKLKKEEKLLDIPVVFLTALKGDKESRIRALDAGAEAFLSKPIEEYELTAQIRAMVKIKKANVEKRSAKERLTNLVNEQIEELKKTNVGTLNLLEDLRRENEKRTKSENALRESELKFRTVADYTFDWEYWQGADHQIMYMSPSCERITGFTVEEFTSDPSLLQKIVHHDDLNRFRHHHDNVFLHDLRSEVEEIDFRIIAKDGSIVNMDHICRPILDDNNKYLGRRVSNRDITERMKAEVAISLAKQDWEETFDAITDLITIHDNDYNIIRSNKAGKELFNLPDLQTKLNSKCYSFYHGTDAPPDGCPSCNCIKNGEQGVFELFEPHLDRFLEIRAIPRFDPDKHLIGLIHIVRDISDRKMAELALQDSHDYLDKIINAVASPIFVKDHNHKYVMVNDSLCKLLNVSADELIGKSDHDRFPEEQVDIFIAKDQEVLDTGRENINEEFLTDGYGRQRTIITRKTLYTDGSGNKFIVGVINDITDRKLDEIRMLKAMEKAQESDRLKTVFLENISHEVRTPLNAIIPYIDLLLNSDLDKEAKKEFEKTIKTGSEQLLMLIDSIVDFAKIESGTITSDLYPANISKIFDKVFDTFKFVAHKKGLDFTKQINLPDEKQMLVTDENKLTQIINNLVGNAIKFTDKGSVLYGCSFNKNNEDEILFYVIDTGIGIGIEEHSLVFERFRQSDSIEIARYGGTGLGLSISKAYVEMLGGRIWLESTPGQGSVFYFTIPVIEISPNEIKKSEVNEDEMQEIFHWGGKTILIAEDNDLNFQLYTTILRKTGAEIIRAVNGQQAIDKLIAHPEIEIILMDIKMPVMDGLEATQEIRKFNKDIPIIAQTAFADEFDRKKALAAGCSDYHLKPVHKELLFEAINSFIKNEVKI